jgi:D-lactate dehydrogenase
MKVAVFSTKPYDQKSLTEANHDRHHLSFLEPRLSVETASLANGFEGVCAFVNDNLQATVLEILARGGSKLIALRSAGYNHIDLNAAKELSLKVVRVPAYSPYAVAKHAVGLILSLNRKIHRAYDHVREGNFSIDGLLGFDLHNKTIGVIGTGKIGLIVAQIMKGFGCNVLAYEPYPISKVKGLRYVSLA